MLRTLQEALDILYQHGLVKFENLLRDMNVQVQDPGMLAVYDLILAAHSRYFATCAKNPPWFGKGNRVPEGCSNEEFVECLRCNYFGNFAWIAANMRDETLGLEKSTFSCWNPSPPEVSSSE